MSKELVISANRHETRVAVLEDDQVVEVFYQRENEYSLAGSIHKGRVTRVLPGMQSAFVDIGLGRDAFLYVSDFFEDNDEYDKIVTSVEEKVLKLDRVPVAPVAAVAAEAAPESAAVPAQATDGVETPVAAAPPAAPLSPPASAMQGPAGFQNRRNDQGGERRGDRGGDRGADRGDQAARRSGRRPARAQIASRTRSAQRQRRWRPRSAGSQILFPAAGIGTAPSGFACGGYPGSGAGGGSGSAAARGVRSVTGRFLRAAGRIAGQIHGTRGGRTGRSGCRRTG